MILPKIEVILFLSAYFLLKLVDVTTIYYPTCQSTESVTVNILTPGLLIGSIVADKVVQVLTLG